MKLLPAFLTDALAGMSAGRALRRGEARSSLTNPADWLLAALGGGPTKSGASVSENTAFNVSAVRACINLRANLLAMLPLKVFRRTAAGPAEQRDHPLSRLLRGRVSGAHTRFKWIHSSQVCFDLGGNAYSRILRNAYEEIEAIVWQQPSAVEARYNKLTGDTSFRLTGLAGTGLLPRWEMLHIANLASNGITGRSPISDLREAVGLALTAEEFSARSFANGNRKPGILLGKEGMTPTKANEIVSFWMSNYAGAANAGKMPLIWGTDWKDMGMSNQDAELLLTRKFSIEEIARIYHLPLHLIGSTDKATTWGSGIEQLNQGLVDYTLQPLCTNWEAEMNTTLLTEQEQEQGYYLKFSVDALLRGSPETRAKVYQIMRGIAAMDVNQIRRLEEWPEYAQPDGVFDDPRLPMNNQGGGGTAPGSADETPAGDPALEAARTRDDIVAAIRATPRPEIHVAAPVITFAERSVVAETNFAPGSIHHETHLPAPANRKITYDDAGRPTGLVAEEPAPAPKL